MSFKRSTVLDTLMILLSIILFCNANGLIGYYLNVNAPLAPVILILCMCILAFSDIKKSDFNHGFLFFFGCQTVLFITGFFVSLYSLETSFEEYEQATRDTFTSLTIFSTYYIYALKKVREEKILNFCKVILLLSVITCLGGIIEGYFGLTNPLQIVEKGRTLGFFGNPNETGLQTNLTLFIACFLFLANRLRLPLFIFVIGISAYGAILTFSKSAIILTGGLLIFFILFNLFYVRRVQKSVRWSFTIFLSGLVVFCATVVIPAFTSFYAEASHSQRRRINSIYELVIEGKINEKTTSERSLVAPDAIRLIGERPVFGYGLRSFSKGGLFSVDIGVHNSFLKIWGEGGILSILLWIAFMLYLVKKGLLSKDKAVAFFTLGILMILTFYFMVSHTVLSRKFVVPLIAIAVAMHGSHLGTKRKLQGKI